MEVTIPLGSITLRAEDISRYVWFIDLVTDKIERQIRKNKTKSNVRTKQSCDKSVFTDALVEDADVVQLKLFVQNKLI